MNEYISQETQMLLENNGYKINGTFAQKSIRDGKAFIGEISIMFVPEIRVMVSLINTLVDIKECKVLKDELESTIKLLNKIKEEEK